MTGKSKSSKILQNKSESKTCNFDEETDFTSFIYELNRHRELKEYTNHWKWDTFNQSSEIRQYLKNLDLDPNLTQEQIVELLGNEIEASEKALTQIKNLTSENQKLAKEVDRVKELHESTISKTNWERTAILTLLHSYQQILIDYSSHKESCRIWEFAESGRLENVTLEEICSCNYYDHIKMIKTYAEKIKRHYSSRMEHPHADEKLLRILIDIKEQYKL